MASVSISTLAATAAAVCPLGFYRHCRRQLELRRIGRRLLIEEQEAEQASSMRLFDCVEMLIASVQITICNLPRVCRFAIADSDRVCRRVDVELNCSRQNESLATLDRNWFGEDERNVRPVT